MTSRWHRFNEPGHIIIRGQPEDWTPIVHISKDDGEVVPTTNTPTYEDGVWKLTLTADEMNARKVQLIDSEAPSVWEGQQVLLGLLETFGNPEERTP